MKTPIDLPLNKIPKHNNLAALKNLLINNKALTASFLNKFLTAGTSVVSIFFVTSFFTPELQGYYYIYNNLILLNFLLDVGFGIALVQFVSHEWAFLNYNENGEICGDKEAMSRLASLIRLSVKWYIVVSISFCLLIGIGGFFFIGLQNKDFTHFALPWFLLILAVAFSILLSPIRSLLDGSNQIAKNQTTLLVSTIAGAIVMWLSIYYNFGLFALCNGMIVTVAVSFILLKKAALQFLKLKHIKNSDDDSLWKKEFRSQQLKIGASWLLGYFMLQSFVPMAFKLISPIEAGKIGATMQLFNLVNMVGMVWVNVVSPRFGILGAQKDYSSIQQLVKSTLKKSLASSFAVSILIIIGVYIARLLHLHQAERFSDFSTIILILGTGVAAQVSNVFTTAIRFQKKEPFLFSTLVCTALQVILILALVNFFGAYTFGLVFFIVLSFILIPWVYFIYRKHMNGFMQMNYTVH